MAENEDGQEKTLDPTPRRREKAREEGQVAVSKDVNGAAQLLMATLAFGFMGTAVFSAMLRAVQETIDAVVFTDGRLPSISSIAANALRITIIPTGGLCLLLGAAAVAAGASQTGLLFSWKALAFKPDRINPIKGLKNLFGPKALGRKLALPLVKVTAASIVVFLFMLSEMPAIVSLSYGDLSGITALASRDISKLLFVTTAVMMVTAAADFVWTRHQHEEELKMTHEEFKREMIDQEGQPHIKARRRQMHRQLTVNRIIDSVPHADVIVTNPTHLAIALRYKQGEDRAPRVTAKGADALAVHIRRLARKHGVAIIENKPLARTLFRKVKVGQTVPRGLYQAVAEVLAQVFRARSRHAGRM